MLAVDVTNADESSGGSGIVNGVTNYRDSLAVSSPIDTTVPATRTEGTRVISNPDLVFFREPSVFDSVGKYTEDAFNDPRLGTTSLMGRRTNEGSIDDGLTVEQRRRILISEMELHNAEIDQLRSNKPGVFDPILNVGKAIYSTVTTGNPVNGINSMINSVVSDQAATGVGSMFQKRNQLGEKDDYKEPLYAGAGTGYTNWTLLLAIAVGFILLIKR